MKQYKGVFPAIITPMNKKDGKLNEEAFRAVMEMNIRAGVDGFWTAGGTGESIYLTDDENKRIAEIAADQNKGRTTVIMQVGAATTARAAKNAENAAKAGVEAICALPPHFFNPGHDSVVEYYRIVGAAANLPLFVYNLPIATGIEITPALMAKIQEKVPQLVGLKPASMDYGAMIDYAKMGLSALIGDFRLYLPSLTIGGTGCVDGPLGIAPHLWVEIRKAYEAKDIDRAVAAQKKATESFDILFQVEYLAGMKAMVSELIGMECGDPRPPLAPLKPGQREVIKKAVESLGLKKMTRA